MPQPVKSLVAIVDTRREVHVQDDYIDAARCQQGGDLIWIRSCQYLAEVVFEQKFE